MVPWMICTSVSVNHITFMGELINDSHKKCMLGIFLLEKIFLGKTIFWK
jgi:hypothetical protein